MLLKNIFELLEETLIFQPAYANISKVRSCVSVDFPNIMFHSGRTDSNKGHNVYKNKQILNTNQNNIQDTLAVESYHYHHGTKPHLHPDGMCPYGFGTKFSSLIDLFISYGGAVFTTTKSSVGNTTYIFEATIEYEKQKFFGIEIAGIDDSFYLAGDGKKEYVENFWGTYLSPKNITRENSPWNGLTGGLDLLVNEEYFRSLIKRYCGLVESAEGLVMSSNGIAMLADFEMTEGYAKARGIGEFDRQGNFMGIYPHYVFKTDNNTGEIISDGGITIGYGYWITKELYDRGGEPKELIDKYAPNASFNPPTIPSTGLSYKVSDSNQ